MHHPGLSTHFSGGSMKHYLLTIAILAASLALYSSGMIIGSLTLFAAGIGCELWFWMRVFRRRHSA
jgi:hypothetical protein